MAQLYSPVGNPKCEFAYFKSMARFFQVMATVTFDSPQAAFRPDAIAELLGAQEMKKFMLHYEFPPFATNELPKAGRGSSRREIGHGILAEKALKHMVPKEFPYAIRLACQVRDCCFM